MNGLAVTLIVLLVLLLIGQVRVGGQVEYRAEGLFAGVRLGALRIQVLPGRRREPSEKKRKPKVPRERKTPKGGLLELALTFIPLVLDTVKKFRRRLRVDKLDMELTIAASDPADAALSYGRANALLGSLWQPITQSVHVKDGRAHVEVDFDAQKPALYVFASLSLTIAQVLSLAAVFAAKGLGILIRNRTKQKQHSNQREAVS